MDQPTKGSIYVDGRDIAGYNDDKLTGYRCDDIGFVFQLYNLIPTLTAYENVAWSVRSNPLNDFAIML